MIYDELLAKINIGAKFHGTAWSVDRLKLIKQSQALRAVVKLHKPELIESGEDSIFVCSTCNPEWFWENPYPCPTIQAIEKELG